jgi:diadenosine tetraphosphate (Ap4A) HIT family hydrolase
MNFEINPILEKDSIFITDLKLCQLRLINNSAFPWVILIPRLFNIKEITDLNRPDYNQLNSEILLVAKIIQSEYNPDKLNIATIGNMVTQMHVHIVARYKDDELYPKTVWGHKPKQYESSAALKIIKKIKENKNIKDHKND